MVSIWIESHSKTAFLSYVPLLLWSFHIAALLEDNFSMEIYSGFLGIAGIHTMFIFPW